jgi:prepilin-type N-terminal cleavage/methylation domain-containing protein
MKANQKGFSVVEILVVVVIVGLLGLVGWLVYDRQKNETDTKDTTSQTNEKTTEQNEPAVKEEVKQPTYFEIKELGVKFELSENLSGLYYSMGNNNKTAYFSLNELKGTDCAADKTAQVALTRYTDADFDNDPIVSKENARKIGNYYYYSIGGQAACSEDDTVQEKASQLRADITKLLPSALIAL